MKNKNKSKKKPINLKEHTGLYILIALIIVIVVSIFVNNTTETAKMNNIAIDQYLKLLDSNEKSYIYIGRTSCTYCQKITPVLNKIIANENITINYLNLENITDEDYSTLTNSTELLQGEWGTPTLLITQNGEVIDSQIGYADYDTTKAFFLQKEVETVDYTKDFNSITVEDYLNLYKGSKKSYIYIGKTSCSYCEQINPILSEIVSESGIIINYLNLEDITEADYNTLISSTKLLQGEWGTPTLLIVQNSEVLNSQIGYKEYAVTNKFLTEK
ncbi:MAG: hypothetical protein PHQ89_02225 [Bacilli bacterium]|nr:hypothetical protein [Bacilli bacterium]